MRRARLRTTVNLAAAQNRRRHVDKQDTSGTDPTPKNVESGTCAESENTTTEKAKQTDETSTVSRLPNEGSIEPTSDVVSRVEDESDLGKNPQCGLASNLTVSVHETSDTEPKSEQKKSERDPSSETKVSHVKGGEDSSTEEGTKNKEVKVGNKANSDSYPSENAVSVNYMISFKPLFAIILIDSSPNKII